MPERLTVGVPIEVVVGGEWRAGTRIDLLVHTGGRFPRWKRADSGVLEADGRVTLRAAAGQPTLLLVRTGRARAYRLEGPFAWPGSPGSRTFRGALRRTLSGSDPVAVASTLALVGPGAVEDPLCESDGVSQWRCLGVPAAFTGRIVACADGKSAGSTAVRPETEDETSLQKASSAAVFRLEGPDSEPVAAARVRIVRPVNAGGVHFVPDASSEVADLGQGVFWVDAKTEAEDRVVEIHAPGCATRRIALDGLSSPCAETARVELRAALHLRGTVSGPRGDPVASATVLVRSDDPQREPTIFGEAPTDENGAFDFSDLDQRVYGLRACHGELGCREERVSPGDPLAIVLGGGGAFAGRVLSPAGVPEGDARVRILPTADAWTASTDRVRSLPLQSRSGGDGRFRIAAPEPGDFLLEVHGTGGGVARMPVRRTPLSREVTDLGDLRLAEPIEFTALVIGCGSGWLTFSGPLGGETSLPDVTRFRLDSDGRAAVRLGEPGAWMAWATCSGENERIEPSVLPDAAGVAGLEVRFERAGSLSEKKGSRR
jgi:hypothetical protein